MPRLTYDLDGPGSRSTTPVNLAFAAAAAARASWAKEEGANGLRYSFPLDDDWEDDASMWPKGLNSRIREPQPAPSLPVAVEGPSGLTDTAAAGDATQAPSFEPVDTDRSLVHQMSSNGYAFAPSVQEVVDVLEARRLRVGNSFKGSALNGAWPEPTDPTTNLSSDANVWALSESAPHGGSHPHRLSTAALSYSNTAQSEDALSNSTNVQQSGEANPDPDGAERGLGCLVIPELRCLLAASRSVAEAGSPHPPAGSLATRHGKARRNSLVTPSTCGPPPIATAASSRHSVTSVGFGAGSCPARRRALLTAGEPRPSRLLLPDDDDDLLVPVGRAQSCLAPTASPDGGGAWSRSHTQAAQASPGGGAYGASGLSSPAVGGGSRAGTPAAMTPGSSVPSPPGHRGAGRGGEGAAASPGAVGSASPASSPMSPSLRQGVKGALGRGPTTGGKASPKALLSWTAKLSGFGSGSGASAVGGSGASFTGGSGSGRWPWSQPHPRGDMAAEGDGAGGDLATGRGSGTGYGSPGGGGGALGGAVSGSGEVQLPAIGSVGFRRQSAVVGQNPSVYGGGVGTGAGCGSGSQLAADDVAAQTLMHVMGHAQTSGQGHRVAAGLHGAAGQAGPQPAVRSGGHSQQVPNGLKGFALGNSLGRPR